MRFASALLATGIALAGCGGDSSAPPPEASRLAFTIQPSAVVAGEAISPPVQVSIQDASGSVVSNAQNAVTLSLAPGSGATLDGTPTANAAAGVATFSNLRINQPGADYTLMAAAAGLTGATSAPFGVSALSGSATTVASDGGDGQDGIVGQPVSVAPSVKVTDGAGLPVAGIGVSFAVGTGGGSGTGLDQVTNAAGVATVGSWTLGTAVGTNTLIAMSSGLSGSPVTFTATASAGPAATISLHGGDDQSAMVDAEVAEAPSVLASDTYGNPVSGVTVSFEVKTGGGGVTAGNAATGTDGVATVGSWTLGSTPGQNTLEASSGSLSGSPVAFNATATAVPTSATVDVRSNYFSSVRNGSGGSSQVFGEAAVDTIAAGGTVTWQWVGNGHNVTPYQNTAFAASGTHSAPFSFGPVTFRTPGAFTYRCTNHSSVLDPLGLIGMRGRIVVR